jgi:hypothetical protein
MPTISADPIAIYPGDDALYYMDWTNVLKTFGNTIDTVDAVEIQDEDGNALTGLTVDAGSLEPNAATFNNSKGGLVAIGKAALFACAGGTKQVDYYAAVTVTLDNGRSLTRRGLMQCRIL